MPKKFLIFLAIFAVAFFADQVVKEIFLGGFRYSGEFFSLILTYNKGVAFSMFAFLGEYLKYIQLALIAGLLVYFLVNSEIFKDHYMALGLLFGAGSSNVYDRFIHGGVVDYVFWHKWFEFAVFNLADVMIDIAVVYILLKSFLKGRVCKEIST